MAVVAQAVWAMAQKLCPDQVRASVAIAAACLCLAAPSALIQILALAVAGLFGWRFLRADETAPLRKLGAPFGRSAAALAASLFVALFFALPALTQLTGNHSLALFDAFYRAGSLVFGGGHVVLPLLQQALVPPGWIGNDAFLTGYGAAQAVPGPLFSSAPR